jgi:hypothetical protein
MSRSSARRRRSLDDEARHRLSRRDGRLAELAIARDQLAAAAAQYAAHEMPGFKDFARAALRLEQLIKVEAPYVYRERSVLWADRDLQLAHDDGDDHPACGVCRRRSGERPAA